MREPITRVPVTLLEGDGPHEAEDVLVVEEPCELRLGGESVAVVMRTPGHDRELAAGFLFSEGIIAPGDVGTIASCADPDVLNPENIVEVTLLADREPLTSWQRNFYAASSCGICGKASIEAIHVASVPISDDTRFAGSVVRDATNRLRDSQAVFAETGGLHAAGLFDSTGGLVAVREDIGRHNAVDKIIGHAYLNDLLPLRGHFLVVSGRSSFEIVQKALVAAIPLVASVSAASSLAVDLAAASGMTLAGFVRGTRMVVYSGAHRVGSGP